MGVFSEIAMEQQNSMFDSSAAFEDDEAFELEEMESLPVPPVGTDAVTVSAASVPAGETASAGAADFRNWRFRKACFPLRTTRLRSAVRLRG